MTFLRFSIILAGVTLVLSFTHPFHASITKCRYNTDTKALEITMRLFTDDLENAINSDITEKNSTKTDSLITRYINKHFSITTPEKLQLKTIYLGRQTDFDLTYVFLEIPSFPLKDSYTVRQTIFFDRFEDQTNIVDLETGERSGSGYFTKGETIKIIELE